MNSGTRDLHEKTMLLGSEPVGKLLIQYAFPAIIAMAASSLYNMVDSIFIGQGVGALALSGLGVTFPFMNLSAAFGAMVGVGASTLISVKLGQRNPAIAQRILGNVITLNLITGILFGLISILFLDPILHFFGASPDTIKYARDYMLVILIGNAVTHSYFGLNAVLRAAGHPRKAMYATIGTVLLNTALDPLFIYTFGWGIQGAAIATVLSQSIALIWQFKLLSNKSELVHLKRGIYGLDRKLIQNIFAIGLSPLLMNLCACAVVIIINKSLKEHAGDLAIGAFSIINKISFLFLMFVMGINQGMQPIAGYNFGAQQNGRVISVLKYATWVASIISTFGFLVGELLPWYCSRIFTQDETLIDISVHGMRIVMLSFPVIGFQMVATNFFQSIGHAKISIFLSLTRQLLFLLPMLLFLPNIFGVEGVWYSMPASDTLSALVTGVILFIYVKKLRTNQL